MKARLILKGVEVYRNLNLDCWSVRRNGLVVRRPTSLTLVNAHFKVSEAGRQRVLREGQKNVHAVACGDYLGPAYPEMVSRMRLTRVSYNPYRGPTFYTVPTDDEVSGALMLMFLEDGSVWSCRPTPALAA